MVTIWHVQSSSPYQRKGYGTPTTKSSYKLSVHREYSAQVSTEGFVPILSQGGMSTEMVPQTQLTSLSHTQHPQPLPDCTQLASFPTENVPSSISMSTHLKRKRALKSFDEEPPHTPISPTFHQYTPWSPTTTSATMPICTPIPIPTQAPEAHNALTSIHKVITTSNPSGSRMHVVAGHSTDGDGGVGEGDKVNDGGRLEDREHTKWVVITIMHEMVEAVARERHVKETCLSLAPMLPQLMVHLVAPKGPPSYLYISYMRSNLSTFISSWASVWVMTREVHEEQTRPPEKSHGAMEICRRQHPAMQVIQSSFHTVLKTNKVVHNQRKAVNECEPVFQRFTSRESVAWDDYSNQAVSPEETFANSLGQASVPIPHLPPKALCRLPWSWVIVVGTRMYQVKVEELAKEGEQESLRD
ncbi:hypothetical protein EDC04DRAFT_3087840 [Pisolithus marmoratus]|nr:hypothetical protein EDC04DRAFT_3087840 [Pisolithus marmoratus]